MNPSSSTRASAEDMEGVDELKHLVTKVLEQKGVMARLRADVKASVVSAIQEQERKRGNVHLENPKIANLTKNPQMKYSVDLFVDFLQRYELTNTLSVFLSEANIDPLSIPKREAIASSLSLPPHTSTSENPLIVELISSKGSGTSAPSPSQATSSIPAKFEGTKLWDSADARLSSGLGQGNKGLGLTQGYEAQSQSQSQSQGSKKEQEPEPSKTYQSLYNSELSKPNPLSSLSLKEPPKQFGSTGFSLPATKGSLISPSLNHAYGDDDDEFVEEDGDEEAHEAAPSLKSSQIATAEHSLADESNFLDDPDYSEPHVPGQSRLEL